MEKGLAPIYDERTEILILGSAPSEQSLKKQMYYGNPANQFWHTIFQVLAIPDPQNYQERLQILQAYKIGLWDVYGSFKRQGSMDHRFGQTQLNDFSQICKVAPLKIIIANGKKAAAEVSQNQLFQNFSVYECPSTSGANNGQMEQRLAAWTRALRSAKQSLFFGHQSWIQAAAYHLRYNVFVVEQAIPIQWEFDGIDQEGTDYFVLFNQKEPIATIRYQAYNHDTIQPDRFCVAKSWRGQGIGRELLQTYERKAINEGYRLSKLSAEAISVGFYEKNGYQVISEPFEEDGVECFIMQKALLRN